MKRVDGDILHMDCAGPKPTKLYYVPREEFSKNIMDNAEYAAACRLNILYMIQRAGAGHIGSAFSALDIYNFLFRINYRRGDIIISSKGHDCAAIYSISLAEGYIPDFDEIHRFRQPGGLPGHCEISPMTKSFICINTGSLGMGLSKAQGIAISRRFSGEEAGEDGRIYVVLGDGEMQEGQNWEALRNIRERGLSEIIPIIDMNGFQCNWSTLKTSPFFRIEKTLGWMGYEICEMNGHDYGYMEKTLNHVERLLTRKNKHPLILADTEKGHGTKVTIGNHYHAGKMDDDDYFVATRELILNLPKNISINEVDRQETVLKTVYEKPNFLIDSYRSIIASLVRENPSIFIFCADLNSDCGLDLALKENPCRYFEFGISEQDMVSAASGCALKGFIPIVHSFSSFLCRRANEQIYNNCTEGKHIIYVGSLAGILPSGPGPSHTCEDDIALMKTMPNMKIFDPETPKDLEICMNHAVYTEIGPVYIRIRCLARLDGLKR